MTKREKLPTLVSNGKSFPFSSCLQKDAPRSPELKISVLINSSQLCKKHHFGIDKTEKPAQSPDESKLMKTLSQIKSNVSVPIKKKVFLFKLTFNLPYVVTFEASHAASSLQYSPAFQVKENKEKERLERRLLDELYKIFMDSDSFYYSMTYDLTNTVQRQGDSDKSSLPLWKQVGERPH